MSEWEQVFLDILAERQRQVKKWGRQQHSAAFWNVILGEEVGEVSKAVYDNADNLYEELIQVAAVAAAWAEDLRPDENLMLDAVVRACNNGRRLPSSFDFNLDTHELLLTWDGLPIVGFYINSIGDLLPCAAWLTQQGVPCDCPILLQVVRNSW